MVETTEVPYLSSAARLAYEKFLEIKKEKSRLQARIKELDKAKAREMDTLHKQFSENCPFRRLPAGVLLTQRTTTVEPQIVTQEMVGTTIRAGYSYNEYVEVTA